MFSLLHKLVLASKKFKRANMKTKFASIILCFVITAQAMAGTAFDGLKEAFDEFNYSVTVDGADYAKQLEQLKASILELQKNGLSNQELIEFGVAQIKDRKTSEEARQLLSIIDSEELPENDAMNLLQSFHQSASSRGASWNGTTTLITASVVIVIIGGSIAAWHTWKPKANVKNNRTE